MSDSRLGAGDVPLIMGGEDFVLKPNLNAAQTISRQAGGIAGAMQAVLKLDLDVITQVVTLGLGYGPTRKPPADLQERIWRAGLTDNSEGQIASKCILYLRVLANGGVTPSEDMEGQGEGAANGQGDNRPLTN